MSDLVERLRTDNARNWQCDGWQKEAADEIDRLQKELAECRKDAACLWMMLDDIDTGGDIAKADDVLYRAIAERSHKRRFEPRYEWVMKHIDDAAMKQEEV